MIALARVGRHAIVLLFIRANYVFDIVVAHTELVLSAQIVTNNSTQLAVLVKWSQVFFITTVLQKMDQRIFVNSFTFSSVHGTTRANLMKGLCCMP